ncbi:MAG: universal stress protein [Haloarculaceae archaeon]
MYDTILVPTDGSDHAVRAGEHARYLADAFDATVHVVTAVDIQSAAGPFDAGGVSEEFVARLEERGEEALEAVRAVVDRDDAVRTGTLRGEPSEAILEYAADHDVDLVAMGTHGRTGVERYVTGSVTERVVSRSEAPVLTTRATERSRVGDGYEEVLVPTDGSDPAAAAVEPGLAVAERVGARVHAVTVVDTSDAASPSSVVPEEVAAHLESEGEAATDRIAAQARDRGLDATTEVRTGVAARDLLAYADEHGVDLVAMGTAGRTGLSRYLLGSTTERVIRHAEMPVLAVNARDEAGD